LKPAGTQIPLCSTLIEIKIEIGITNQIFFFLLPNICFCQILVFAKYWRLKNKMAFAKQIPANANIWLISIFGKNLYLAKACFWQKPIFSKSQYLAKGNIWQEPIFGKSQYLAKANI
jgi:hypothetical protein